MDDSPTKTGYPEYSYPDQPYQTNENEIPLNWKRYGFIFLSKWYWFIICLGIALGIAFFKIRYSIPQFQAATTILIEEEEGTNDILGELRSIRYRRRQVDMANEVAKLSSFSMVKRAIDSLDDPIFWTAHGRIRERPLYHNPRFTLNILVDTVSWYKNQKWYIDYLNNDQFRLYRDNGIDTILAIDAEVNLRGWIFKIELLNPSTGHNTYHFVVNDPVSLAKAYRNKLQIEVDEKEGTLISLKSTGPVGPREVDYLNTLTSTYIMSGLERKQEIAENAFHFIDAQISIILDSLTNAEDNLLKFRLTNNVINLSREGEIAYEKLKGFHEKKTELKLKENYYNYLRDYVVERSDPKMLIAPSIAVSEDLILTDIVKELQHLYESRENLEYAVMNENPGLDNINQRISGVRKRLLEVIDGLINNNNLVKRQLNTEEQAVLNQLKTLPVNEQQLLNIRRKYDLYNQFYTFLLQRRAETGIQKASTISNVRLIDQARYDQLVQVGNDKMIIIIFAIILGLLIPSSFFLLKDIFDTRIKERGDITNRSTIPILGIIGHSEDPVGLPIKDRPNSPFAESLRRIRTNLQFILREPQDKVIMVTSSVSGEGKTFIAANLSAIFAINNKKVLLVGCDLRRPSLHKVFGVDNSIGLSSYIIKKNSLEDCILDTRIANLKVLLAGPVPPNPAELLETTQMNNLFEALEKEYDYIILDTPPLALVSDSLALSSHVNTSLFVVRQHYSNKDVIDIANIMQREQRLPNLGLIINDIKPSKSLGYNYYYGYNQGYNYGYYDYRYSKEYYSDHNNDET